jgi:hypothetical protein
MPGEATTLARPPRDLRLDVIRGWMQVSIFISHVAGSVFAWAIHASWGLSDSSEQFVLLSGLALGSVFTLKAVRDGMAVARADLGRRTLRLYGTHLTVFLGFAAMVFAAGVVLPLPGEVARLGWGWLAEAPWFALPAAATMLYQPDFMGILPVFVWCMLLLPSFMWLAARWGGWALAPSLLLWGAVQFGWLATPALGRTGIAFDPLAWQLIFLIGALAGRRALLRGTALPRYRALTWAALSVVLFGLAVRLVDYGVLAGPVGLHQALLHKEILAPARLLHALSLAWLVAVLVPREAAWMHAAPGRLLAAIGRHSLRVFCVGLFLAWGASIALRLAPEAAAWLDPLLIGAGVALLGAVALLADRRRLPAAPVPAGARVRAQTG